MSKVIKSTLKYSKLTRTFFQNVMKANDLIELNQIWKKCTDVTLDAKE